MLKGKYKALISDIDGTLTPLEPNALPSKNLSKNIKRAVKKGLYFSLASGRPYFLIKYLIEHLGNISPCTVDNGAVIVDSKNGSVIWEALLSSDYTNKILDITRHFKLVRVSSDTGGIDNPKKIPVLCKVRKVSIHDIFPEQALELINTVNIEFKDVASVKAASYKGKHLVDVYFSNINATKQHAVIKLAEILEITPEEIIGVGDGYNDIPLLIACGLKIAMGNAVEDLKVISDYIAPTVEEDGMINVLKKFYF